METPFLSSASSGLWTAPLVAAMTASKTGRRVDNQRRSEQHHPRGQEWLRQRAEAIGTDLALPVQNSSRSPCATGMSFEQRLRMATSDVHAAAKSIPRPPLTATFHRRTG